MIDPIGPENDLVLLSEAGEKASMVMAAWGTHGAYKNRNEEVMSMLPNLYSFGTTKDGHPKHPLYIKADTQPRLFGTTTCPLITTRSQRHVRQGGNMYAVMRECYEIEY